MRCFYLFSFRSFKHRWNKSNTRFNYFANIDTG